MKLAGVFATIPTPFDADERLDPDRLGVALSRWLPHPLAGFVLLGSNGEAVFLDDEESDRVVEVARKTIPGNRPLIVGTGREATRATILATKRAAALGADVALVRTPGFFKAHMTSEAFVDHYLAVADQSQVPVLLYNFTAGTGVVLPVDAVSRLAAHPNIIGMKESAGDLSRLAELMAAVPPGFQILTGSSTTFCGALRSGAVGGILALAAVLPDAAARLFDLVAAGQFDEAEALQQRLLPLARLLGTTYGVPGIKAALALVGYDVGAVRRPLARISEAGVQDLKNALALADEIAA